MSEMLNATSYVYEKHIDAEMAPFSVTRFRQSGDILKVLAIACEFT